MKISLSGINYYFLTTGLDLERKNHMVTEFQNFNITEVNPFMINNGISKNQSVATGFLKIIEYGLSDQRSNTPFQPFGILEDDVSIYRKFPELMEIPDDTDLLYIGISESGYGEELKFCRHCDMYHEKEDLYVTKINDDIYKIYNMLSFHGVVVCSVMGANMITRCMMESYYKDVVCDVFLSKCMSLYNVYALNEPLVYQDERYNGQQKPTKMVIESICSKTFTVYPITNPNIHEHLSASINKKLNDFL